MATEGDVLYYIDDFSDEVMPCAPYLDAWAEWLSKPAEGWGRDDIVADGAAFNTSVMRIEADIVATRLADGGWSFSREPHAGAFLAIRYDQHMSWDADDIIWGEDMGEALRDWFADDEHAEGLDDEVYVAVGTNLPDVTLVFHAGPPPTMEVVELAEATVQ